jgi:hypothetical protein
MKRLLMIVVPVVVLLGGFLIWWSQPAKVVARRVAGLLQAASVEEGTSSLVKGTRGNAVEKYLSDKVTLDGPAADEEEYTHRDYTRSDLVTNFSMLASAAKSITIKEPVFESIDIDGDTATVQANVEATVDLGGKQILNGTQKMTLTWVKNPDGWQLSKAAWTETGH